MEIEFFLDNENKTIELGIIIAENLPVPCVIYLEGDLGTGKTHLCKGIINGLGVSEDITSPTFTLINEYVSNEIKIYHLDLYRLDNLNQVLDLGIEDFIDNKNSVTLIEWSEKLGNYKLSETLITIKIFYQNSGRKFWLYSENENCFRIFERIKKFVDTGN